MNFLVKLAGKELRHSLPRLRVVFLILILGLIGPLFTSALRSSVDDYIEERSRNMLSADLSVQATRPFRAEERQRVEDALEAPKSALETSFVTMGKGRDVATLIEVKAVDRAFPVFGTYRFQGANGETTHADSAALSAGRIAWVFPEVLAQLGLKPGDMIGIGRAEFRIAGVLEDAPGLAQVNGFAPRVFIGHRFVEETGLTQFGSQVFHRLYLRLPEGAPVEIASAHVKAVLPDPDIFLRTPDDSSRGFERFFRFFNLYLVSATMIVFALSWVSAFYILQIFVQERLKSAAILLLVGASRLRAASVYVAQIFMMTGLALAVAVLVVLALVGLVNAGAGDLLPRDFVFQLAPSDVGVFVLVVLASSFAFSMPLFVRLYGLKLGKLLAESSLGIERLHWRVQMMTYGPVALVFFALSTWLLESWSRSLQLLGGLIGSAFLGWWIGRVLFRFFFGLVRRRPGLLRLIATQLSRSRFGMNLCFLALLIVTLVLNLVPHLLKSALHEVDPAGKRIPSFFLFNIPESQVDELSRFMKRQGADLSYVSPMILGRLLAVNGEPTEDDRFQRFPVRVTYREKPIASETIVEGREFPGPFDPTGDAVPEISMEVEFAERNNFGLGDLLRFDVQGLPIEGRVTSLRKVRWTDFNPNFFISFQPGVLDDAPKTFLANVTIPGTLAAVPGGSADRSGDKRVTIQYELIRQFPDLSVIDIGRSIQRGLEIAQSVIGPIRASAVASVLMSFFILVGVIAHNLKMRHAEVDIEKLLGAESRLIRRLIVSEYLLTGLFAAIFGSAASLVLSGFIVQRFFEIEPQVAWSALIGAFTAVVFTTTLIAWVSSGSVLNLRGTSRKL